MNITDGTSVFEVNYKKATFKGMIMPFSGSFDTDGYPIDSATNITRKDWHICDGTNGTPDLRGRFILGASDGHAVGSTGGEENHTLSTNEMPAHNHTGTTSWNGNHSHSVNTMVDDGKSFLYTTSGRGINAYGSATTSTSGNHTHTFTTNNTGGGQAHNNMPPYYALSYIMKI